MKNEFATRCLCIAGLSASGAWLGYGSYSCRRELYRRSDWCEVAQKAKRKGVAVDKACGLLDEIGLAIVPFSAEQAECAADLWEQTRRYGLSLADRACLALERKSPVLTADRAWADLGLDVEIRLVR